jgi:N-carbamoyl-L-amino-acid hydrolase
MPDRQQKNPIDRLSINLERLRSDIDAVNALGRAEALPGINRVSFSDADMAGRRWLIGRFEDGGLSAWMDAAGNVFGRWEIGDGPAVLAGSHLDTVPQGGALDGTLGVCAALEAVRAMKGAGIAPIRPVEIVCTADEEGRFGGMFGSQAICGEVGLEWIEAAVDDAGVRLADAMRSQGFDPASVLPRDMSEFIVFLELHIEQGPVLERTGIPAGIVSAVSGVFNWTVTLDGEANHSGTTPMDMRRDAFRGLADFGAAIPAIMEEAAGPESRLTIGKVELSPNFPHSIAGEAVFSIIGRDIEEIRMEALAASCRAEIERTAAAHGLGVQIVQQSWLRPAPLDRHVADRLAAIAKSSGVATCIMPSGGGHDAQTFARHLPAGLIFVPSAGGISHSPDEHTEWRDIEQGANLLARAIADFATS